MTAGNHVHNLNADGPSRSHPTAFITPPILPSDRQSLFFPVFLGAAFGAGFGTFMALVVTAIL